MRQKTCRGFLRKLQGRAVNLTIEQALLQGVAAHNEGKLQKAELLYQAILKSQPTHPDANHNLGLMAVSANKVEAALPLFKLAIESNSKIEQFWVSYIDALIKEKQINTAWKVFKKAKKLAATTEKLNAFESQLVAISPVQNSTSTSEKYTFSERHKKLALEKKRKKSLKKRGGVASPSEQELNRLLEYYNAGQDEDTERSALSMTEKFPNCPLGWKVLGVVLKKTGRTSKALQANRKAVELSPKDAEVHNNMGATLKELDRLEEAEASYRKALVLKPDFVAAHYNLGNMLSEHARLEEAEISYRQALSLKYDYAQAHNNLGLILRQLDRGEEAEGSYKQAIAFSSSYPEAHYNLANILKERGRIEEAEARYREAIALKPDYAEAHNNLGVVVKELGRKTEAETCFKQALAITSNYAECHNNLGITLKELGRLKESEASLRRAISLDFDYAEAHLSLGITLLDLGNVDPAIEEHIQALKIKPELTSAYFSLGIALEDVVFRKPMPHLIDFVYRLLDKETFVRPTNIAFTITSILKFVTTIKNALKKSAAGQLSQFLGEIIGELSNERLLMKLMEVSPIPDLELEDFFKEVRSEILDNINPLKNKSEILTFQVALALQCHINEYLYDQTDAEREAIVDLENLLENKLARGEQPNTAELACLASYKELYKYSWIHLVDFPLEMQKLQRRQIIEPQKEKSLRTQISSFKEISNSISSKVKEQYEENPYPRWVNLGMHDRKILISELINIAHLNLVRSNIAEVATPKILIAGCGTGAHSITTASLFKDCDVLAVDLSLSSLAYASRKTEELGITNIEYMQADILDLGGLNRKFDIIESGGVLHHMGDPMSGWKVLVDCLKPGGLMKIGLYSELARQHIKRIREDVTQLNMELNPQEMRLHRRNLIDSHQKGQKLLTSTIDFYSLSSFRDLIFHEKEHRFTIPLIQDCLHQLGLSFCGFEDRKIVNAFKVKNQPEQAIYNLQKWASFEKENPHIFTGMYQFWCQKN